MLTRFESFTSNIATAYKYIIKIKAHEMKEFGLKAANTMCLFYIGKHESGLTAVELCNLCKEDKGAISKSVATLKKMGYINEDNDNGTKKYRVKYKITDKGVTIYKKILKVIDHTFEICGNGLSEEERQNFYINLEKIVQNLEEYCKSLS